MTRFKRREGSQEFGNRLRSVRMDAGLSQISLGDLVGVSQNTICRYEIGECFPDSAVLVKIAESLGVTVDYLVRTKKVKVI